MCRCATFTKSYFIIQESPFNIKLNLHSQDQTCVYRFYFFLSILLITALTSTGAEAAAALAFSSSSCCPLCLFQLQLCGSTSHCLTKRGEDMANRVIVYGGRGALGSKCVQHFKSKGWWVASVDIAANEEANENVIVKLTESFTEQAGQVTADVAQLLGESKVDAILCVAGGWAGGNCSSKDFFKNSDLMWKQSVWTSTISSHLAARHLKSGGLLTLAGAKAAQSGTGGMVGYGMAKAAIHQLCQSLAAKNSGMPAGAAAVAILPVTLDTPMNRKFMPDADYSSWTPLEYIAEMFFGWATGENRPASGSLMQLLTSGGETQAVAAQ